MDILRNRATSSEVVGTILKNGVLYELENEDNGWIYVESGNVRGFVREEDLIRGDEAEEILEYLKRQEERISSMLPAGVSKEMYFFTAQETVPYYENDAYAFRRITTEETVIDAEAAASREDFDPGRCAVRIPGHGRPDERRPGLRDRGRRQDGCSWNQAMLADLSAPPTWIEAEPRRHRSMKKENLPARRLRDHRAFRQ